MNRILTMAACAALACGGVAWSSGGARAADEPPAAEAPKPKKPSSLQKFTKFEEAVKAAKKYDLPILTYAYVNGNDSAQPYRKMFMHKMLKDFATKNVVIFECRMVAAKPKDKAKAPKGKNTKAAPNFDRIKPDELAAAIRKMLEGGNDGCGLFKSDGVTPILSPGDVPKIIPELDFATWMSTVIASADAKGLKFELSKQLEKYLENPPEEKQKKGK